MTIGFIDSHAHLGAERFDEDRAGALARAQAAGVETVIVIGYDAASSVRALEVAREQQASPALFATAGIAPHHVAEADGEALRRTERLFEEPEVVAVGEIGLDYHYDMPRDAQLRLFATQIEWARSADLPVVVHSREAEDDVVGLLRRHGAGTGGLDGVIHCFTESEQMAEAAVDLGFFVSFAGILTFKNAVELRATAARVPLEHTLIETDSPYLAPEPHRGKRNEPAYVVEVARALAAIHGVPVEHVAEMTSANARRLFRLP